MRLLGPSLWLLSTTALLNPSPGWAGEAVVPPEVRKTVYGPVVGSNDAAASGTYQWKGIPFAKPPAGSLRWMAPVEPESWATPMESKAFGQASVQYGRIYGPGSHNTYDATIGTTLNQAVGSEDCLTLNIWRPATAEKKLPIINFNYGGSNVSGYTADPVYDGAALARKANAVVVTANYRVGVFGWFNLPQLKTGTDPQGDSGNFGTLDQILALKFIQRNIANFGGDPGNVTVMGQSAGAVDVYTLLTSPLVVNAKPQLIHKAIAMSGGAALATELPAGSIATLKPAAATLAQANKLLYSLLIADGLATDDISAAAYVATQTNAQVANYLRAKTPGAIFTQLLTKVAAAGLGSTWHMQDGVVVANTPLAAINAGSYLKVPILVGITREETKLFAAFLAMSPALGGQPGWIVNDAVRFNMMMTFNPEVAPTLTVKELVNPAYLPVATPAIGYDARLAFLNNLFFIPNRDIVLKALSAKQPNVWCYEFAWAQEPAPWNEVYGAAHAFDLPFVFGNWGPSLFSKVTNSTANKGGRLALSGALMGSLGAFARHGDPNHALLGVQWPAWPKVLLLDATLTEKKISVR
jgi:para-nitrobenzyl esterase